MRKLVLVMLATGGLAFASVAPAAAVGTRYPFCIQGAEYPGLSNCSFTSYAQCMATASGRYLTCIANPYFAGERDDSRPHPNRSRSRSASYPPVDK